MTPWSATPTDERWVYQLVCSDTVGDMDGDFIGETAPGTMFRMRMTGGSSGTFGFVVLGAGLQFPPLDLSGYGAPGCAVFPLTQTNGLVLKGNTIRDTREGDAQKQTVGIKIEEKVGRITISGNNIQARRRIEDLRVPKLEPVAPDRKTD